MREALKPYQPYTNNHPKPCTRRLPGRSCGCSASSRPSTHCSTADSWSGADSEHMGTERCVHVLGRRPGNGGLFHIHYQDCLRLREGFAARQAVCGELHSKAERAAATTDVPTFKQKVTNKRAPIGHTFVAYSPKPETSKKARKSRPYRNNLPTPA